MNWKEIETNEEHLYCWELNEEIETKNDFGDELVVNLISEDPIRKNDLNQFDFNAIKYILKNVDLFIVAIEYIKEEIRRDSTPFKISEGEIKELKASYGDKF